MTDEYEKLLDGTVGDVKSDLGDYSRDELRDILQAEKNGKDRKTLKEAVRKRMQDLEAESADAAEEAVAGSSPALRDPRQMLTAGLVIGVIVAVAAVLLVPQVQAAIVQNSPVRDRAGGGQAGDALSAAEAEQSLMSYLEENKDTVFPPNTTLQALSTNPVGNHLYTVNVVLTVDNRTQPLPFYVTADGSHLVSGNVFDMSQPLSEQIQQRPQRQPPQ